MPRPFAAFDVDGTIFKSSLLEKAIDACIAAHIFDTDAFNEAAANRRRWQINNNEGVYQAYLHHLVGAFVTQIAGVNVEQFNQVAEAMVAEHTVRKFIFPRRLMHALEDSHHIVAISGSPTMLVEPFLGDVPVQSTFGSTFDIEGDRFTGGAASVGDKAAILRHLVSQGTAEHAGSVAVGDTISDAAMLGYAATAIMFNPSRTLTNHGAPQGWLQIYEVKDRIVALKLDAATGRYVEHDAQAVIDGVKA